VQLLIWNRLPPPTPMSMIDLNDGVPPFLCPLPWLRQPGHLMRFLSLRTLLVIQGSEILPYRLLNGLGVLPYLLPYQHYPYPDIISRPVGLSDLRMRIAPVRRSQVFLRRFPLSQPLPLLLPLHRHPHLLPRPTPQQSQIRSFPAVL